MYSVYKDKIAKAEQLMLNQELIKWQKGRNKGHRCQSINHAFFLLGQKIGMLAVEGPQVVRPWLI